MSSAIFDVERCVPAHSFCGFTDIYFDAFSAPPLPNNFPHTPSYDQTIHTPLDWLVPECNETTFTNCSLLPRRQDGIFSHELHASGAPEMLYEGAQQGQQDIKHYTQGTPTPMQLSASDADTSPPQSVLQSSPAPKSPPFQLVPLPRRFECKDCKSQFLECRQLANHRRNEHKRFNCSDCGKEYRHYKSLWDHRRRVHGGFVLACDQCGYETGRKANLQRHKDSKHRG